ncbi:urease accessory protein UreF [Sporolactobacillus sp. Y61]|uniref:Urease accessory protein UreF n=1 Tax=Sporolactobacillus sp. Y61 TaxID=3160863 RepID=A0AAU8IGG2_9BACL
MNYRFLIFARKGRFIPLFGILGIIMNNAQVLSLMQLVDSNFPIGNFSHSYGLETYIQEEKIKDRQTMSEWLSVYFGELMLKSDGLGCFLACEALKTQNDASFLKVSERLEAMALAREVREANRKIGVRFLTLGRKLFPDSLLDQFEEKIQAGQMMAHPALVFAIIGYSLDLNKFETTLAFLYSIASSLIQNAVRGIPLGQTEGQLLLQNMGKRLENLVLKMKSLSMDDLGATPPGLEIAQMRHEHLTVRIFMS